MSASAAAASATATAEPRWLAWLGCWEPVSGPLADAGPTAERVCVLPGEGWGEIQLLTLEGTEVALTTPIRADGVRRNVTRGGCSGWETGQWSEDGRRILLRSELDCEGGLRRVSSGILAMLPDGHWLDVQAIDAGREHATRVVRYRPARVPANAAPELESLANERRLAIQTARADAAVGLSIEDVIEAVQATNAQTTAALVVERGDGFDIDASSLLAMRRAGVPGELTDLVVALSFPTRFAVDPDGAASQRPPETVIAADGRDGPRRGGRYDPCFGYGHGWYDPFLQGGLFPYGMFGSRSALGFGFGSRSGLGFGCSPFAYGGRYGWYGGRVIPIVVPRQPEAEAPDPSGRMVRGEGYRGDPSVDGGRRAVPRGSVSRPDRSSAPPPRATGRSGSSTGARAAPPASSSGSGSDTRRARPRGGSGGS